MDLVAGVRRVVVLMEHATKNGEPKILQECDLPLTGKHVVNKIITDMAIFDITKNGLLLTEHADDVTIDQIKDVTGCTFSYHSKNHQD